MSASGCAPARRATTSIGSLLAAVLLLISGLDAPSAATPSAAAPAASGPGTTPVAGAARRAALPSPVVTPRDPVAGERITLSGTVPKRWRRTAPRVLLQVKAGKRWTTVARPRLDRRGAFAAVRTMPKARQLVRVAHPRRALSSRTTTLAPRRQVVTLATSGSARRHGSLRLVGSVSPARAGRKVTVQEQVGGRWVSRAVVRTDARGSWHTPLSTTSVRLRHWRAVGAAHRGAPAVTSPTLEVAVRPLTGTIVAEPAADQLAVTVVADQPVDEVELFLDERPAGRAVRSGESWTASLDASSLAAGEHRVTARLVRGAERGLVASASFPIVRETPAPDGYDQETLAGGLTNPTTFAVLGTDSALVAEKAGAVWLITDGVRGEHPVIDLSGQVDDDHDRGLTGLAVHPDFDHATRTGWVYLAYVWDDPDIWTPQLAKSQRVSRIRLRDGVRVGAEEVILGAVSGRHCDRDRPHLPDCIPSWGTSHTIGDLLFHPDGSLYVSVGDGVIYWGEELENIRAQSLDVLAGKILRIDPETGLGLPDNPYYDDAGTPEVRNRNRVYASGLRNPFRMSLDRDLGLVVGEVGANRWEELNRVRPGANFGWPCFEGTERAFTEPRVPRAGCPEMWQQVEDDAIDLDWPTFAYPHRLAMGSVTAGVTLPSTWPYHLAGRFLYADYVFGEIRTVDLSAPDPAETDALLFTGPIVGTPVKMATDAQGRLWYLSIFPGELRRIEPAVGRTPCGIGSTRAEWFAGPEVTQQPAAVTCADGVRVDDVPAAVAGSPHAVRWRSRVRTDGGPLEIAVRSDGWTRVLVNGRRVHDRWSSQPTDERIVTTAAAGVTTIVVEHRVTGPEGSLTASWSQPGGAPTVAIDLPSGGAWVDVGEPFPWRARARDAEGRDLSAQVRLTVELMHHGEDDFHLHPVTTRSGSRGELSLGTDHAPGRTAYRLTATVTDARGRVGSSTPAYVCLTGNEVGVCA